MSKWIVFAYAPDLYGNVHYGLEKDSLLSAQAWQSKDMAELFAAAWNGDNDKLMMFAELLIAANSRNAELEKFVKYILQEAENGVQERGYKPIEAIDSDNTKIDIHVFVDKLQKAKTLLLQSLITVHARKD